jgi:hypothetical protein
MKLTYRILSLLALVAVVTFSNCGGGSDPGPSAEETQLAALKKTWTIESAIQDNAGNPDRTSEFSGFTLTINGTFNANNPKGPYSYSVSGTRPSPSPWPQSGTWEFGANVSQQLVRDPDTTDELAVSYTLNGNTLEVTFECANCDYAGSRVASAQGPWTFTFTSN